MILGGESFSAVAEGLQEALWKLAASRASTEPNSLSAAFKNLDRDAELDFTRRYDDLCRHYGMEATRNNPGVANENGSIEAANGHIKVRLDDMPSRQSAGQATGGSYVVHKAHRDLGLKYNFTPHTMRHTVATWLAQE